jgi:hypothetical protein
MKYFKLFLFTFVASFCFIHFTAAADAPPAFGASLLSLISAVKVGTVSAILLALGQVLKSDFVTGLLGGAVNSKVLPWITTITGVIISVGTSLAQGQPWYVGVVEGIMAGLASNGVFDHLKVAQTP